MLEVPVIFMSGRGDDRYIATAFELGAADYIVKPFSPTELLARISAALRRHVQSQHVETYRQADLTVDYLTRTVTVAGQAVSLTPTEYQLLSVLCTNAGRALTYDQLLEHLWGQASSGDAQRVRTSSRICGPNSATTRATPRTSSPSPTSATALQPPERRRSRATAAG